MAPASYHEVISSLSIIARVNLRLAKGKCALHGVHSVKCTPGYFLSTGFELRLALSYTIYTGLQAPLFCGRYMWAWTKLVSQQEKQTTIKPLWCVQSRGPRVTFLNGGQGFNLFAVCNKCLRLPNPLGIQH